MNSSAKLHRRSWGECGIYRFLPYLGSNANANANVSGYALRDRRNPRTLTHKGGGPPLSAASSVFPTWPQAGSHSGDGNTGRWAEAGIGGALPPPACILRAVTGCTRFVAVGSPAPLALRVARRWSSCRRVWRSPLAEARRAPGVYPRGAAGGARAGPVGR